MNRNKMTRRQSDNQTYWTNWPTKANLGPGCNGAFWAHTGQLVITNLKATNA